MPKTPYHKETGAMLGEIIDETADNTVTIKNRFDQILTFNKYEIIFDNEEAEKIARQYNAKKKKKKIKYKFINENIPLWVSNFVGFSQIAEGAGILILLIVTAADMINYALFGTIAVVFIFLGINLLRLAYWSWFATVFVNVIQCLIVVLFIYERLHLKDFSIRYVILLLWPAILLRMLFKARDNFRG
jgi:hypothetical protein